MPIDPGVLDRDLLVAHAVATPAEIRRLLEQSGGPRRYVVVRTAGGRAAAFSPGELIAALWAVPPDQLAAALRAPVSDLSGFLAGYEVEAVDAASMTTPQAEARLRLSRHRRLLVLADGEVLGLLADRRRGGLDRGLPWPAVPGGADVAESPAESASGRRLTPPPLTPRRTRGGRRPAASPAADEPAPPRFLNCEVLDHDRTQPLAVGEVYTLALDVDEQRRDGAAATSFDYRFVEGEEQVALTVELSSSDFEIHTDAQVLRVPRRGRSRNKVRFDVEPRAAGTGTIDAIVRKDGNFVQHLTISLWIETPCPDGVIQVESTGRPLEGVERLRRRDATLLVQSMGDRFQAIWCLEGAWPAELPITLHGLAEVIEEARAGLREVVYAQHGPGGTEYYLDGLDIPEDVDRASLRALAAIGFRLFRRLFFDGAGEDARAIGTRILAAAERGPLKFQIVSRDLVLPWGLLYLASRFDGEHVEPERFLGLKHIVEHLPFQPRMTVPDSAIPSRPRLSVSLNVNMDIDEDFDPPLVVPLVSRWTEMGAATGTRVVVRQTAQEVLRALTSPSTTDQIIYLFCHAETHPPAENDPERAGAGQTGAGQTGAGQERNGGGRSTDAARIILTGDGRLSLADLKEASGLDLVLPGAPLVFINACGSSDLSPLFYNGFGPQLLSMGARGVIGTECDVPAIFAAAWADRFFELWLAGTELGEAFLTLRREFYGQHRNLLGLLYAVYCDADTQVVPALALAGLSH